MTDSKIGPAHLQRDAFVYIRQSTFAQVERNRESTLRQYGLAERAHALGWDAARVRVLDEDLGLSGSTTEGRDGFARLAAEIALGRVGLVLGLEVSRLARNNADWYRLLDLCGVTDTLIGDADGVYHPGLYNDRLLLGLLCRAQHNRPYVGQDAKTAVNKPSSPKLHDIIFPLHIAFSCSSKPLLVFHRGSSPASSGLVVLIASSFAFRSTSA